MARKPRGGYEVAISSAPTADMPQRYARLVEILLRAKKQYDASRNSEGRDDADDRQSEDRAQD